MSLERASKQLSWLIFKIQSSQKSFSEREFATLKGYNFLLEIQESNWIREVFFYSSFFEIYNIPMKYFSMAGSLPYHLSKKTEKIRTIN